LAADTASRESVCELLVRDAGPKLL